MTSQYQSYRMRQTPIKSLLINLRAWQVPLYSMDSTSVYGPELLVLEGTGGKALATDHRGWAHYGGTWSCFIRRPHAFCSIVSWSWIGT